MVLHAMNERELPAAPSEAYRCELPGDQSWNIEFALEAWYSFQIPSPVFAKTKKRPSDKQALPNDPRTPEVQCCKVPIDEWIGPRKKTSIFAGASLVSQFNFEIGGKGGVSIMLRMPWDGCFFAYTGTPCMLFWCAQ